MCGICGLFEPGSDCVPPTELVKYMSNMLSHRGPDAAGCYTAAGVGLGHRRLSIIDLSSGQQPMCNEDGTVWIVFNGEIYNYRELHAFLEAKGHRFCTKSDTETILHMYEEVGEACFSRLRGMFAIALFDRNKRQIVLARDRIGKKPLYYSWDGQRLVFGSELKAILAAGGVDNQMDATAVADYFSFTYIPAPQTIYKSVRKLRAGHYLVVRASGIREQCYWDLSFSKVAQQTEDYWCEAIRESLADAVGVRLMSEVPLGAFLSGGVDSSAVVSFMSRLVQSPVTSCTVGFDEQAYSEVRFAREVANLTGADYHETTVRARAIEVVHRLAWHYDEPFADSSAIPTFYVSKIAREHVTVALSGDGGDENFAGYHRYYKDQADNRLRHSVPSALRRHLFAPLGRWYPPLERAPRIFRAKSKLESLGRDPLEGYLANITTPTWVTAQLFSEALQDELHGYDPRERFREHYHRADTPDLLSRVQYLDIKTYLTDDICTKVDRASMAVSLEVRSPLLDHRVMEMAARIPSNLKLRGATGKYIFKKAISGMFPPAFFERRKQGFGVPIAEWFRGELKELAHDVLLESKDGILDRTMLQQLWVRHQAGVQDHSAVLWAAFMFRLWQERFRCPDTFKVNKTTHTAAASTS